MRRMRRAVHLSGSLFWEPPSTCRLGFIRKGLHWVAAVSSHTLVMPQQDLLELGWKGAWKAFVTCLFVKDWLYNLLISHIPLVLALLSRAFISAYIHLCRWIIVEVDSSGPMGSWVIRAWMIGPSSHLATEALWLLTDNRISLFLQNGHKWFDSVLSL